jgi:hypothetical protein
VLRLSHPGHLVISLLASNRDAHQIHDLHIRKYFSHKCMIFSSELLQRLALFDSCCFCCCSDDDNKESISLLYRSLSYGLLTRNELLKNSANVSRKAHLVISRFIAQLEPSMAVLEMNIQNTITGFNSLCKCLLRIGIVSDIFIRNIMVKIFLFVQTQHSNDAVQI